MFELFASTVALCSLGATAVLAFRVKSLSDRLERAERQLASRPIERALPDVDRPLQGLRVKVEVEQDHPHPLFANLLKELLLREDAVLTMEEATLSIRGRVVCNGYADVYYTAELTGSFQNEPICVLVEKPPHGDRQENLAREFLAKLTKELGKTERRAERHSALRELGEL